MPRNASPTPPKHHLPPIPGSRRTCLSAPRLPSSTSPSEYISTGPNLHSLTILFAPTEMSLKRAHDAEAVPSTTETSPPKKRKGFTVGPANLPDGTYRRKAQKIKADLISKAKTKKAYAKIKAQHEEEQQQQRDPFALEDPSISATNAVEGGSNIHPDRAALQASYESSQHPRSDQNTSVPEFPTSNYQRPRKRHPKPSPYTRDHAIASTRREDIERKQVAREQRDTERKMMAKAKRPDKSGKMKLGRQSKVLLGRVHRLVGEGRI